MENRQLIKTFKKEPLQEFTLFHGVFLSFFGFMHIHFPTLFVLDIFIVLYFVSSRMGSVIKVYKQCLLCYNPLYFWKPKKLFYFKKIEKITLSHNGSEYGTLQNMRIHHMNGKAYDYSIRSNQAEEFKNILLNLGIRVIVENYRVF